jgi:hypothetical protein
MRAHIFVKPTPWTNIGQNLSQLRHFLSLIFVITLMSPSLDNLKQWCPTIYSFCHHIRHNCVDKGFALTPLERNWVLSLHSELLIVATFKSSAATCGEWLNTADQRLHQGKELQYIWYSVNNEIIFVIFYRTN